MPSSRKSFDLVNLLSVKCEKNDFKEGGDVRRQDSDILEASREQIY